MILARDYPSNNRLNRGFKTPEQPLHQRRQVDDVNNLSVEQLRLSQGWNKLTKNLKIEKEESVLSSKLKSKSKATSKNTHLNSIKNSVIDKINHKNKNTQPVVQLKLNLYQQQNSNTYQQKYAEDLKQDDYQTIPKRSAQNFVKTQFNSPELKSIETQKVTKTLSPAASIVRRLIQSTDIDRQEEEGYTKITSDIIGSYVQNLIDKKPSFAGTGKDNSNQSLVGHPSRKFSMKQIQSTQGQTEQIIKPKASTVPFHKLYKKKSDKDHKTKTQKDKRKTGSAMKSSIVDKQSGEIGSNDEFDFETMNISPVMRRQDFAIKEISEDSQAA